jgi:hypothetical protein
MSAPSNNFSPGNTVEPPNNPGTFIGKIWRAKICGLLTCFLNPKIRAVVIPSDGSPHITVEAEIAMAANGWTATIDLTKVGGVGGGNDSWPPPELDTTVAHSIGDRVYISPGNILVTAGMIDLDSNILTVSLPGIWRAVTAVPAAVSSQYNVPQLPLPGASGAVPTGTPMKGDADGAQVHWLPEWINDYCAQNP